MADQKISLPSIGQVVKAWRAVRGLSGTELGARAGLPKAYISQVEHGKVHQPGDDNLARIAGGLQIPVEYLVTRRMPDKEMQTAGEPAQLLSPIGTSSLRHRRSGSLASPPIDAGSEPKESTTIGQDIDEVLEGLSQEELDRLREILVPHARQLAGLMKLNVGGGK